MHGGVHRGVWRYVEVCGSVQRYTEVCMEGCVEVHGGVWRCVQRFTEVCAEVCTGMHRGVCGGA